ncbi:carbon storage regulator CsrA [Pontibacillus sp. HMF3514]|uniref:carbon storage regulator CsrA n=1 Tax=Pontibacillus sp. HMF3514 TaxID=2692425 RepID=UPI0013200D10|nr:carbon storage regulator CsrA [Pontibacillus sp. HMF3514]QHE53594.1 carbon storage regulator CsrA [Pontibacillus sp. HMF3514]
MLILNRKVNDSIQIDDDIEVKIISIEGDQVKIGIEAPKSIDVFRKEIYLKIQEENEEASNTTADLINLLKSTEKD